MKESYAEDLANHGDHESCADDREIVREALDNGMYRLGIEPRKAHSERRRCSGMRKATSKISILRDINELCVVEDPIHVQKFDARKSGDPAIDRDHVRSRSALKIQLEYSNDERLQEVGHVRST